MKTSIDDELMESLAQLRRALPSMRLGQLIANMATVARGAVPGAVWEAEDHELLDAMRWQLEQLTCRAAADDGQTVQKRTIKASKRAHAAKPSRTGR